MTLERDLRHTITPRGVWVAWQAHEARQRGGGARIAAWLAHIYDIFLGREPRAK